MNFPERYILDKIDMDYLRCEEILNHLRPFKIVLKCIKLINNLKKVTKIDSYIDPIKLKSDIESIQNQCVIFIVKNKLMPKDKLDQYSTLSYFFRRLSLEIPKIVLFRIFPILSEIENMFIKIMKP